MNHIELGFADLHVHTTASDGLTSPADCLGLAQISGLDSLAITDHDEIEGAIEASKKASEKKIPIFVVLGTEITTAQGHLVALFINSKIPMFRSLVDTVKLIHEQRGLAVAPHVGVGIPPASIAPETISGLYKRGQWLDGIEILNPIFDRRHENQARDLWRKYNLAAIGASDDHYGNVGRYAVTCYQGFVSDALRRAIESRRTIAMKSALSPLPISPYEQVYQHARSLTKDLRKKIANSPELVSTLIFLRREQLEQIFIRKN
ncbi:MAG: PHP domain-containing protein [Candidatus Gottesmanbacteria bacterium]